MMFQGNLFCNRITFFQLYLSANSRQVASYHTLYQRLVNTFDNHHLDLLPHILNTTHKKPQIFSAVFHDILMYSVNDYLLFGNTWRIALYPTPTRKAVASRTDIVF